MLLAITHCELFAVKDDGDTDFNRNCGKRWSNEFLWDINIVLIKDAVWRCRFLKESMDITKGMEMEYDR